MTETEIDRIITRLDRLNWLPAAILALSLGSLVMQFLVIARLDEIAIQIALIAEKPPP